MFDKIKKAFLNLFTILFIATILGCPSPNTEAPEDNSYKLVDLKAEQSTTTTNADEPTNSNTPIIIFVVVIAVVVVVVVVAIIATRKKRD